MKGELTGFEFRINVPSRYQSVGSCMIHTQPDYPSIEISTTISVAELNTNESLHGVGCDVRSFMEALVRNGVHQKPPTKKQLKVCELEAVIKSLQAQLDELSIAYTELKGQTVEYFQLQKQIGSAMRNLRLTLGNDLEEVRGN